MKVDANKINNADAGKISFLWNGLVSCMCDSKILKRENSYKNRRFSLMYH
jgi:hypothetical protein